MKLKELKKLAVKIAACENLIQTSTDKFVTHQAQDEIMNLSKSVHSLEDIMILDELVQDILQKS